MEDILGTDGEALPAEELEIRRERFLTWDLRKPLRLERSFDLAISVEVAEHLPAEYADTYVDSLVRLAPVVLFSAAVPLQYGLGHVNEQWPDYWAERFAARSYAVVDCVRHVLWMNDRVEAWYVQNVLLFVAAGRLDSDPGLRAKADRQGEHPLRVVHPKLYVEAASSFPYRPVYPREFLKFARRVIGENLRRKLPRERADA